MLNTETLFEKLKNISNEVNKKVLENFGLKNLLNENGSMNMSAFSEENGGPYNKDLIATDIREIKKIEEGFAGVEDETNQFVKNQKLQNWRKDKSKQKSTKTELLTSILLHKVLQENFIVARSATLDDYQAGVDYIVVNPKTGETICAFDGVAENDSMTNELSKSNSEKKKEKIQKIAKRGGTIVKYGIQLIDNRLVRTEISNVPVFYLSISDKDFEILSNNIMDKTTSQPSSEELRIFSQFIQSLEIQREELLKLDIQKLSPVYQKILNFDKTLNMLRNISNKTKINKLAA